MFLMSALTIAVLPAPPLVSYCGGGAAVSPAVLRHVLPLLPLLLPGAPPGAAPLLRQLLIAVLLPPPLLLVTEVLHSSEVEARLGGAG